MNKYERYFKLPDFKNVKEKQEFYNRAYATFCVGYMEQIKDQIKIESLVDDKFFDNVEKRSYPALKFEAFFPKFKIIGTDFSNKTKEAKPEKIKSSLKITKSLPKEKEVKNDV